MQLSWPDEHKKKDARISRLNSVLTSDISATGVNMFLMYEGATPETAECIDLFMCDFYNLG